MEKEIINFEKFRPFIRIRNLEMVENASYRGMHSHPAVEIVEVIKGSLVCNVNNEIIKVNSGQIIMINSNVGHKLYSENSSIVYTNIDINSYDNNDYNSEFILLYDFISRSKSKKYLMFSGDKELCEILRKIKNKYYENNETDKWYLKAYIYELIAFMHSRNFISSPFSSASNIKRIKPVVQYIDKNYKSHITLDDISKNVRYGKFTICHTFKEITGSTISEYINFLRIYFAIDLLKQKSLNVLEISNECGFSSVTYFNRVFKNIVGCSPSIYKKYIF